MMAQCYQKLGETSRARVSLQVALKLIGSEDSTLRKRVEAVLTNLASSNKEIPQTQKCQGNQSLITITYKSLAFDSIKHTEINVYHCTIMLAVLSLLLLNFRPHTYNSHMLYLSPVNTILKDNPQFHILGFGPKIIILELFER